MRTTSHKIKSLENLQEFAKDFLNNLKGGDVITLSGTLGAGKTTLVQMIARELGIKQNITSPTFTIIKTYDLPTAAQKKYKAKYMCHIDLYRLDKANQPIGFEEYIKDKDYICFVEWPERVDKALFKDSIQISIKVLGEKRIIKKQG
jgi:tRNA threonylcarbamoyladenosine biosynthesis protein TsaE